MEEFLSSTQQPIGASDLFRNSGDPPRVHEKNSDPDRYDTKGDLAWILALYLLGVIGSLIVAGSLFF